MFAGPNGSGKTTIKRGLQRSARWFGIYINPDELEESVRKTGQIELEPFGLATTTEEIQSYFASSAFLQSQNLGSGAGDIQCSGNLLDFRRVSFNSYYASVLADFFAAKPLQRPNHLPSKPLCRRPTR